jgi:hypothetical protein
MSDDAALHYRHPPARALQLNKLLYRVRMDSIVRKQFIQDPDSVIAEYHLSPEEAAAVKALDVNALSKLGAHPLLSFMANYNVQQDRRAGQA